MLKKLAVTAALTLTLTSTIMSASSYATVLTFDDYLPLNVQPLSSFNYDGFTFTFTNPDFSGVWNTSPNGNGTPNIVAGYNSLLTITRTGGGLFNLNSIDAVISWYSAKTLAGLSVNGGPSIPISRTLATYALGLIGVSSVTFSGLSDGYWSFDNVDVDVDIDSTVPIPPALPLLATALGLIGYIGWRKSQTSA